MTGGGTIASTRTLTIDSSELASLYSKVIVHDNTNGFVADEHVAHTGVSIIAGKGLTGGGNIASSRTIDIDSANVRGMFSAGGDLSYNSGTGEFSFDVEAVYTKQNFDSDYFFAKDSANTAVERNQHDATTKTFAVTVASKSGTHVYQGQGSGSAYYIDGTESPIINLKLGRTYRFNLSSSDMSNHPFRFYYDAARTTQYTTGVTTAATYTEITITESTPPVLHYQCSSHGYMGHAVEIGTRNLTGFTTTNLTEGSNLYYTDTRARQAISLGSAGSRAYNNSNGQITIPGTTDHITEGSNLFFTDARAQAVSLDSAEAIQLIDSAYVQARQLPSTDSAATQAMIDSNFNNDITLGGDVIFDSAGGVFFDKSLQELKLGDNVDLRLGDGNDLLIRHSGVGSDIINTTGNLIIADTSGDIKIQGKYGEQSIVANNDGSVELYYDNTKKLETTDSGVNVTGEISADSAKFDRLTAAGLIFPASDGLNNQVIRTDGNGNLSFVSVTAISGNIDSAAVIQLIDSDYVQLRTAAGTDSAATQAMIDSSISFQVDSAYVQLRQSGGAITVQEEGSSLSTEATTLNFVGSNVTATGSGATKTITITGGGGTTGTINNVKADTFTGDASTKTFTLSNAPADSDDVLVFINGVLQHTNTYSISGLNLTLDSAPDSASEIETRTHLLQSTNLILRDHKSYVYTLDATTDSVSGADSAGVSLTYDVGKVDVFANGARLVTGKDFTATDGTSIVFDSSFTSGNVIEVVSHGAATTAELNGILAIDSDLTTTAANQTVYSYTAANHRTLKFTAQIEHDSSSSYHAEEVLLTHNGTNVAMTTYAQVLMDSNLGTFDADINSGNVRVKFTPTKTNTSIKLRAIRTPA